MKSNRSLDRDKVAEFFEGDIGLFVEDTDGFYGQVYNITSDRRAVVRYPDGTEKVISQGYLVDRGVIKGYIARRLNELNRDIDFFGFSNEEV